MPADAPYEAQFETRDLPYGGDLQGVRNRLAYIRQLGFNTICLSRVFQTRTPTTRLLADSWHVREDASLPASSQGPASSTTGQDARTPGDRLLLELMQDARKLGMRVILDTPFALINPMHVWNENNRPAKLEDVRGELRRWTAPAVTGADMAGPDAFLLCTAEFIWRDTLPFAQPYRDLVPDASKAPVLLFPSIANQDEAGRHDDGDRLGRDLACWIRTESATTSALAQSLEQSAKNSQGASSAPQPFGEPFFLIERATTWFRDSFASGSDAKAARLAADRSLRLFHAMRFCLLGAVVMPYGDEVGMTGRQADASLSPMWWVEPGSKEAPSPDYRADFLALVRLMNRIRAAHEPLRRGNFEVVLADDARRLLAFSRTYGEKQVIVVVNASNKKQEVEIVAGVPGGLVGVMRPELEPLLPRSQQALVDPTKPVLVEPKLRIAGNRSIVDAAGKVRLNLDPMSLKLVLVGGDVGQ
ncbi:MAG: alpha-glucosidase C-terminal domain-containing protein [Phycisphaerales bacterium]|nr:alpha-glucosidase C-terminal domain-containing protein [Phycisphaerales bacterium]